MEKKYTVVSLFSGAGGLDMGFYNKGFDILWANDIDKDSCATHKIWSPTTNIVNKNIKDIDLNSVPNSDVIIGGFPCLTGDSLVLTKTGYKKLIDIKVGDLVLSHDNKYHKVLNFFNQGTKKTFKLITNNANYIKATGNHKFYIKKENGAPQWVAVEELIELIKNDEYYISSSLDKEEEIPIYKNRDLDNYKFWDDLGKVYKKENIEDEFMASFLEDNKDNFKNILINLPCDLLAPFLFSYMTENEVYEEKKAFLYFDNNETTLTFLYLFQKAFKTSFYIDLDNNKLNLECSEHMGCFYDDKLIWNKIESIEDLNISEVVYDIEVEETHSFMVNNFVSHNCQGFSLAGPRKIDDSRNTLYKFFVDLVEIKKPKIFLAENVKGILTLGEGAIIEAIKEDFSNKGYKIYLKLLNASNYSVPQDRERVIIIGVRNDISDEFIFPKEHDTKVTIKEALKGFRKPKKGETCLDSFSSRFMSRNRKRGWDEQSFTIPAMAKQVPIYSGSPDMIKKDKDLWEFGTGTTRRFSYKECAALQTFPKDMAFVGDLNSIYKQIGNAVPVKLAEVLAVSIKDFLDNC